MHFITGHTFIVKASNNQPQQASQMITAIKSVVQNKNIDGFETGKKYQIYYIKPEKDKVTYQFKGPNGVFSKEFPNISVAEELIGRVSGAVIPDYKKFYEGRKD